MSSDLDRNVWDASVEFDDPDEFDDENDLDDLEELDNIITLTDENGNDIQFEFLDLLEYEGEEYVILLPLEDEDADEDGAEVVILRLGEDNPDGTESYESVDDPQVLEAVYEVFKEKFKDEFHFVG
ncbi:MAG: DUF1292 domain-containing protein [Lachnospiraceae bacterium]|nr:DUF1292 domain-containing protein [Lachnospiraceae bacterium]